jgi:hypothetical protein
VIDRTVWPSWVQEAFTAEGIAVLELAQITAQALSEYNTPGWALSRGEFAFLAAPLFRWRGRCDLLRQGAIIRAPALEVTPEDAAFVAYGCFSVLNRRDMLH